MIESRASNHQFFNSESSFGSESKVSNSRANDLTQQLIQDTDGVFVSLHQQLTPIESQTDSNKIQIIYNRARILLKQSIPEHLTFLKRTTQNTSSNSIESLFLCQERLARFSTDYEDWNNQNLQYKQFFKRYSRKPIPSFKKRAGVGEASGIPIDIFHNQVTDVVQIVEQRTHSNSGFKGGANRIGLNQSRQSEGSQNKDKKIKQLYDQINRLKRQQQEQRKYWQLELINEKSNSEKRINELLKLRWNDSLRRQSDDLIMLKNQLFTCQQKLQIQYQKHEERHKQFQTVQKQVSDLKHQKTLLSQDLQSYKRMQNSRLSDAQSQGGKSVKSQLDIPKGDVKKLQKMVNNLMYEKNVLRNELNKQRQINYSMKDTATHEQKSQIENFKRIVQKLSKQKSKLYSQLDRLRVQSLKIKQNDRMNGKMIETLKTENQSLKVVGKSQGYLKLEQSGVLKSGRQDNLSISSAQNNKPMIVEYDGDGIEGYPYYELLNRQFRVRFKRSCLREKQLLHKSNGLQIGVITEFVQPSQIKVLLHLTNYSDFQFKDMRVKVMNPNDNKISFDKESVTALKVSEQAKLPVFISVKFYPIGPVILVCQYINSGTGKKQEVRILLPVHICKTMAILPRENQELQRKDTIKLKVQKKIVRDFNSLAAFFKGAKQITSESLIKAEVKHGHTNTTTYLDLKLKGQELDISYENILGSQKITDYFVKTLAFLLSK